MKKSLLFDLDGTLWDPMKSVLKSWDDFFKKYDLPKIKNLEALIAQTLGSTTDTIASIYLPDLQKEKAKKLVEELCIYQCDVVRVTGGVLYENVQKTLRKLSENHELFIVSNCQKGYIEAFLDYYDELKPFFKDWECFGNTERPKGENIRRVIERNQLSPAAFVGDKESDRDGAHENNLPFVWAAYGFGENVDGWKWKIENFEELENIFM